MRQQSRPGNAARDRTARRFRLHDLVAAAAGQLWPNLPDHFEARRNIFQNFRDIFTKMFQFSATVRASCLLRRIFSCFTRQMLRQGTPRGFCYIHGRRGRRLRWSHLLRLRGFKFIEPQLQLLDLAVQLFRFAPKLHAPQLGDQQLQVLDFAVARN